MSKRLYYLIQQAKTSDPDSIEEIIERFDPKIKKTCKFTGNQEREDLEQELKIRVVKAVGKFKTAETPGFREFIGQLSSNVNVKEMENDTNDTIKPKRSEKTRQ